MNRNGTRLATSNQCCHIWSHPAPSKLTTTSCGGFSPAFNLLGTNPSGAFLSGAQSLQPTKGVATFTGLSINRVGSGYTFVATAPGPEDLSRFTGEPAIQPIRVYVGVDSAPTLRDQASLAVRELERTGAELAKEYNIPFQMGEAGEQVQGKFTGTLQLASGKFAMIENAFEFQLVPWRPAIDDRLGREITGVILDGGGIEWRIGRVLGLGL